MERISAGASRPVVLVVDDDPDIQDLLSHIEVLTAADSDAALTLPFGPGGERAPRSGSPRPRGVAHSARRRDRVVRNMLRR